MNNYKNWKYEAVLGRKVYKKLINNELTIDKAFEKTYKKNAFHVLGNEAALTTLAPGLGWEETYGDFKVISAYDAYVKYGIDVLEEAVEKVIASLRR